MTRRCVQPVEKVIEVRGLSNRFGPQVVHENLDLDLYRGEILGVVGGSGAGKSVLLRSIVGLQRPAAGSVRVLGQDLLNLSDKARSQVERRFGVLFQKGALFSSLTITENVALALIEHAGLSREEAEHLAGIKMALAGLPLSAAHKYPASLSGGMIKRGAGTSAGAGSGHPVSGRTHCRARSDRRRRLRSVDSDPARRLGAERVHGHP